MEGHGGGNWECSVRSVCIQALLFCLASSLEESIDWDPIPNLSLFWREYITKSGKSALMTFPLHLYPPAIPLGQTKVKTTYWRRNISHIMTAKKWNMLPRELVPFHTLELFETRLSDLVQPHNWPYFEQEVGLETSWSPFQPVIWWSYDPVVMLWSSPVVPEASSVLKRNSPVRK